MTTVNDVLGAVQHQLHRAGIDSPAPEAAIIVSHVLGITRGKLGVMQALGERLNDEAVNTIHELARQRATRIPLQHLLGETTFYGVDLKIEPGVFIPRLETEVLVETTLAHFEHHTTGELAILDLCTGSGAIAAALAEQFGQRNITTRIWAVDLDPLAVQLAQHNTAEYNVSVLCADATDTASLLEADPTLARWIGHFNAVVSNPPYIPTVTPVTQQEAEYDPQLALYGGSADGLDIPSAIAQVAAQSLAPGGYFIMEHDETHAAEIAAILERNTVWEQVHTVQDLTATNRFVSAVRA
jgi:release factor glutamine methyltransferase